MNSMQKFQGWDSLISFILTLLALQIYVFDIYSYFCARGSGLLSSLKGVSRGVDEIKKYYHPVTDQGHAPLQKYILCVLH